MRSWVGLAIAAVLAVAGPAAASGKRASVAPTEICTNDSQASVEAIVAACSRLLSGPDGGGLRQGHYRALRGEALMTQGRTEEALRDLDLALRAEPDNVEALTVRGRAEITLGRRDAAQADIDRALKLAPDEAGVLLAAGELAVACDETAKARRYFDRVVELSPGWFIGYFDRGRLLLESGDAKGALGDLDKAAALTPANSLIRAYVLAARAGARYALGDLDGANADLTEALDAQPDNPLALVMRGQIRFQQGQRAAGLADVSAAVALLPDNPSLLSARATLRLSAPQDLSTADLEAVLADLNAALALRSEAMDMANKAYVLKRLGRFAEALTAIDQAIAIRKDNASLYAVRGDILLLLQRRPEARAAYDAALAVEPSADLWTSRAWTWGPKEQEQALADIGKALALQPSLHSARETRIAILVRLGRFEEAEAADNALLAENPKDADGLYWRARLRARQGQYAAALADLDQILPRSDDGGQAFNLRCYTRAIANLQLTGALADCEAALKLHPGYPAFLDSRGLTHLRLGQYDLAVADYDAVLAQAPDTATSLYGRGLARLRQGRAAEGQADLAAARALSPTVGKDFAGWGLTP